MQTSTTPALVRLLPVAAVVAMLATVAPAAPGNAAGDYERTIDITFPVAGPVSYIDDYDACRSDCTRRHKATDIMVAEYGQPVHAAENGVVSWITGLDGNPPSYGYMVTIRTDTDHEHHYVHLGRQDGPPSEAYVAGLERGSRVARGDLIGWAGCSGNAACSAPHLHFAIEDPSTDDPYGTHNVNPYNSLVAAEDEDDVPGPPVDFSRPAASDELTFTGPARLIDTRNGTGAPKRPLGSGESLSFDVVEALNLGKATVGAVLNITAVEPTQQTNLVAWATGEPVPTIATLNAAPGSVTPNLAFVPLSEGWFSIRNANGQTDVVVDVVALVRPRGQLGITVTGSSRLLDTRTSTPISSGESRLVPWSMEGAEGLFVNLAALQAAAPTNIVAHPSDEAPGDIAHLNVRPDDVFANLALAPVGPEGLDIHSRLSTVDVVVDQAAVLAPGGSSMALVDPVRIRDTRTALGGAALPLLAGESAIVQLPGLAGTSAAIVNVAVTNATHSTWVAGWASGADLPGTSLLNVDAGETLANLAIVPLGPDGNLRFGIGHGAADLVVDLVGYIA